MKDLEQLYETVKKRNPNDKEFLQAVEEVFESLNIIADVHPEELDDDVLERLVEPERQIIFRVPWVDDNGKAKKRVITCGDFTAEGVTVVEGLHQGDRIIVEGQQKVCNDTKLSDISL